MTLSDWLRYINIVCEGSHNISLGTQYARQEFYIDFILAIIIFGRWTEIILQNLPVDSHILLSDYNSFLLQNKSPYCSCCLIEGGVSSPNRCCLGIPVRSALVEDTHLEFLSGFLPKWAIIFILISGSYLLTTSQYYDVIESCYKWELKK